MCGKLLDYSIFVLEKYVLNLPLHPCTRKRYELLISLANALYGNEIRSIREERRCPFCGRSFSRRGLRQHLLRSVRRGGCSLAFQSMLEDIARMYVVLDTYLWRMRYKHMIPVRHNGSVTIFRSRKELREAMIRNPQILINVLNDALREVGSGIVVRGCHSCG